jgi:hypothetical protein
MRRKSFSVLLFLLALAVQVIAPVVGGKAFAHEHASGGSVSICRTAAGGAGDAPSSPTRHDGCAICQILCDGVAPVGARDYSIASAGAVWFAAAWASRDFVLPTTGIDHLRRARAPPSFS